MKILHFWWKIMSDYLMHHLGIRYEPRVETRDSFSNLKYVLVCKQSVFQLFPLILHILWDFYAQYDLPLSDLYNLIPPVVRSSTMGRHMMSALCTICTSSLSAWVIKIDFVRTGIRSFVYANEWMGHLVLRFSFCFKKQRRRKVYGHMSWENKVAHSRENKPTSGPNGSSSSI